MPMVFVTHRSDLREVHREQYHSLVAAAAEPVLRQTLVVVKWDVPRAHPWV